MSSSAACDTLQQFTAVNPTIVQPNKFMGKHVKNKHSHFNKFAAFNKLVELRE